MRFSTPELAELEARITQAADRALALELEIFARLTESVLAEQAALSAASAALAELDHYAGLAELAVEQNYVRPKIDASLVFAVEEGRHPMVEQNLRRSDGGELRRQRLPARRERRRRHAHPGGDRAQHGGQIDLPAPERADRRAGAVGLVRAGAKRPYRRRRSPVQPRRRGRRSRPRPLDLHGRDGRDRRDPQSGDAHAPSSCSTRSAAARRPSTGCRSPGPRSNICTRSTARACCSPPTITS